MKKTTNKTQHTSRFIMQRLCTPERKILAVHIGMLIFICLFVLVLLVLWFLVAPQGNRQDGTPGEIALTDSVRLAPHVSAEMLIPQYWYTEDAQEVRMNDEEIEAFNRKTLEKFKEQEVMFDLEEIASEFSSTDGHTAQNSATSEPISNEHEKMESRIQNILLSMLPKSEILPDNIVPKCAILTDRVSVREKPSRGGEFDENGDLYFDELQQGELYAFEPVLVLHTTANGEWYFVLSDRLYGWVEAKSVALCEDYSVWLEWMNAQDGGLSRNLDRSEKSEKSKKSEKSEKFLTVTGKELRLDKNPYQQELSELTLSMGTKLVLASQATIANRQAYGCHVVKLPTRNKQGYLEFTYAYVPISEDVHVGYVDYTEANLLQLAFKAMGTTYGWGGMNGTNDCSGYILQIFRCFGFRFPRNSANIASVPGEFHNLSDMDSAEKLEVIESLAPGAFLLFPGHIMMYLGERDGRHYVISALNSFVPDGNVPAEGAVTEKSPASSEDDTGLIQARSVMINTLDVRRANGHTWLEDLTTACCICRS